MRYACSGDIRIEAQPGMNGLCNVCGAAVIAKCGTQRIWHWAHVRRVNCDVWWEPETEWHRAWKSNFPEDWQEYILRDEVSGERHIADVRTEKDLVMEFQHSHLVPKERAAREAFYRHMVWVVDGTRLLRDEQRFLKRGDYCHVVRPGVYRLHYPERFIHKAWIDCTVPVIFDFGKETIWCLFPGRVGLTARLSELSPKAFIRAVYNDDWSVRSRKFMRGMALADQGLESGYASDPDKTASNVARLLADRRKNKR